MLLAQAIESKSPIAGEVISIALTLLGLLVLGIASGFHGTNQQLATGIGVIVGVMGAIVFRVSNYGTKFTFTSGLALVLDVSDLGLGLYEFHEE